MSSALLVLLRQSPKSLVHSRVSKLQKVRICAGIWIDQAGCFSCLWFSRQQQRQKSQLANWRRPGYNWGCLPLESDLIIWSIKATISWAQNACWSVQFWPPRLSVEAGGYWPGPYLKKAYGGQYLENSVTRWGQRWVQQACVWIRMLSFTGHKTQTKQAIYLWIDLRAKHPNAFWHWGWTCSNRHAARETQTDKDRELTPQEGPWAHLPT